MLDRKRERAFIVLSESDKKLFNKLLESTRGVGKRDWISSTGLMVSMTANAFFDILTHIDGRIDRGLVIVNSVYVNGHKWTVDKGGNIMEA